MKSITISKTTVNILNKFGTEGGDRCPEIASPFLEIKAPVMLLVLLPSSFLLRFFFLLGPPSALVGPLRFSNNPSLPFQRKRVI